MKQLPTIYRDQPFNDPRLLGVEEAGKTAAMNGVDRTYGPLDDLFDGYHAAAAAIRADRTRTEAGKAVALAELSKRTAPTVAPLLSHAAERLDAILREAAGIHDAIDGGMCRTESGGGGWLRPRDKEFTEAEKREIRDVWRAKTAQERVEFYRARVVAGDDSLVRVLDDDPTSLLVSAADRAWARQWRIDHAPDDVRHRLALLDAQVRAHSLLLEASQRAARAVGVDSSDRLVRM